MAIFVTGGTGLIGRHVLANLTRSNARVLVLMRNLRQFPLLQNRVQALGGASERLEPVPGDLSVRGILARDALPPLDAVIHLGAAFGWRLPPEWARQTNVEGAFDAATLARDHQARLVMVTGFMLENPDHLRRIGVVNDDADATDWRRVYTRAGAYEASKVEAALRVRAFARTHLLELVEVQPGTVAGHSITGELDAGQPLHELMDNLISGRLALVPGSRHHWLPLISVDALSELIAAAVPAGDVPARLLALDPETPNLVTMFRMLAEELDCPAPRRHIPMPVLRALLRMPGLPDFLNTAPESLHFLQTKRFDTRITKAFRQQHNLSWPSIENSIRVTAANRAGQRSGLRG